MKKSHHYSLQLVWTGNKGEGTSNYRSYDRNYTVTVANKPDLPGSADPAFRGDPAKHNPEELFVAALSSCHLLTYLHLCADEGITVTHYRDTAKGTMEEDAIKGGCFTEVILHPEVTIIESWRKEKAMELHEKANKLCFIANSCNFPIKHDPVILTEGE